MAKIRVYELARTLNMNNKELLQKLEEMEIEVKSHMSSLEDQTVELIKTNLLGRKPAAAVEETRVKSTVIRRRKKPVKVEAAEAPQPEAAEAAEKAEEKVVEEAAETPAEEIEEEVAAAEKTAEDEAVVEAPEKPKVKKTAKAAEKAKPVKKKKGKKEAPAKIIKLPVKPKVVKPKKGEEAAEPEKVVAKKEKAKVKKFPAPERPVPEAKPAPEEAKAKDKKKKRKRKDEDITDAKFFKKKISFRRKEVIEGEDLYSGAPKRARKGRKGAKVQVGKAQKTQITTPKAIKRRIRIDDTIVLSDLAKRMGIKANEMIAKLMALGVMATVNQTIDFENASLVAGEFEYEVERATFEEETVLKVVKDEPGQLAARPPVVTIMGHVDHGKTSMLDVIRKTRVTEGEAGGITQHIGAYHVNTGKGYIVFLDTPGHEAFTAMRSRGASVTDIVILVVAADDGVMPQTVEAINHARAAGAPIIVAINKIDKANAEPEKVQRELAEEGLLPEDWGGETIFVPVSAKTHEGLDNLLEMVLLQAEMLELEANPEKPAIGHVVEARLDSGRGPVATVLIKEGTLRTGTPVVCGVHYGKVRAMLNDSGQQVQIAGPAIPVEVIGLSGVPMAGDDLVALKDEKSAKQVSMHRLQRHRSKELAKTSRLSLDKLYESLQAGEAKDLNVIIKADVNGSIEALRDAMVKLSNEEININVIHSATGTVSESDVSLATVSEAIIIGFNVRPTPKVQEMAQEEHVDMRFYSVIYDIIKDIQDAMVGMMESTFEERVLGRAEVRETFHIPRIGTIAGCYVTDGRIERGQLIRVLRDGVISYDGKVGSLRRFKDDAKEVQNGFECGIGVENFNDVKIGDILECYYLEEIKPVID